MSRVHSDQKFMNTAKHKSDVTGPSKVVRIHQEGEDYHNASSLTSWLFMKHDISYKSYRNKPWMRRQELREEYEADTGNAAPGNSQNALGYDHTEDPDWIEMYEILSDCGVPFAPDGTPLGIGDD